MGELCLVPDSFLCLPEELSDEGNDSDLESLAGGVGVDLAELGALDTCC